MNEVGWYRRDQITFEDWVTFNGQDLRKRVIVSGMREGRCFEGYTSIISHGNE